MVMFECWINLCDKRVVCAVGLGLTGPTDDGGSRVIRIQSAALSGQSDDFPFSTFETY